MVQTENQTIDSIFSSMFNQLEHSQPSNVTNLHSNKAALDALFAPKVEAPEFDPLLDDIFYVIKEKKIDAKSTRRMLILSTPAVCEYCGVDLLEGRAQYPDLNDDQKNLITQFMKQHDLACKAADPLRVSRKISQRQANEINSPRR